MLSVSGGSGYPRHPLTTFGNSANVRRAGGASYRSARATTPAAISRQTKMMRTRTRMSAHRRHPLRRRLRAAPAERPLWCKVHDDLLDGENHQNRQHENDPPREFVEKAFGGRRSHPVRGD